ncbi:MAG: tRNA epoxyqueuosine(34) reductase QueG [Acidimicrobiaceae bacterium]|nr:tRNA epoxyqueuosine(34) reductase QueG [Acidimicrobiaceae bacterium]
MPRRETLEPSGGITDAMTVDVDTLATIGRTAGLCAIGVCRAEPFSEVAAVLHERKQVGLHGGMQFTYRNPERSTDPTRLLPGAAALIVGALEFEAGAGDPPSDGGPYARVAAYARRDYYQPLRTALEAVAAALRAAGHRAVVSADGNGLVDRAAAHRAGIGWWGKNSNILVPGVGSLVVLGAVVTDAPIAPQEPESGVADGCGSCRQCLDGCPTGAIIAPGTVDARRCLAWLVQADGVFDPDYRVALGDRIYGCDDCSDVCPPNRVRVRLTGRTRHRPDPVGEVDRALPSTGNGAWVPVLEMLDASDGALMAGFGRWYIPRREPRYLRRNALVVLANVGDRSDSRVRSAVDRALRDPDPLIRAHAVWCARRLGLGLDALSGRDDPLVRAEMERPVRPRDAA